MLNQFFPDPLTLGIVQAVIAALMVLATALLARQQRVFFIREISGAMLRGLVQIVCVGFGLALLLKVPFWLGAFILLGMATIAAQMTAQHAKHLPGAFLISLIGISLGSGLVIGLMTWLGVIEPTITSLVPVGSMIISSTMRSNSQALERFRAEILAHERQIEAGLALGATPKQITAPYVQATVYASLLPHIDSLQSLGIVWIPGLMTGMVLSGASPIYAALYQFVVMALIVAAARITALVTTTLIRDRLFSSADQLLLPIVER